MTTLTETEIRALNEALEDEYRAFATYEQVLADFGEAQPFNNIRDAEARHIEALHSLFARYGLSIPENPWPGKVDRYTSLQAACEAGVAAEIANAEIYQRLLQSTERPDILTVFRNLQDA
jgi:rubrerythrin